MLSLGGERLPPLLLPPLPTSKKKRKKFWIITCTTIWVCYHYYGVFFVHLLILKYPDCHQNLISSSLYYPGPLHKISSQSIHNLLRNVVHRQIDKPTLLKTLSRSTQRAQTSLAEADYYSHMPTVKMLSLAGKRLTPHRL